MMYTQRRSQSSVIFYVITAYQLKLVVQGDFSKRLLDDGENTILVNRISCN